MHRYYVVPASQTLPISTKAAVETPKLLMAGLELEPAIFLGNATVGYGRTRDIRLGQCQTAFP